MGAERYRYLARNAAGFVDQLQHYVQCGYRYYLQQRVPERKWGSELELDRKLMAHYEIGIHDKVTRARRKRQGKANMQYLRLDDEFILLATAGAHRFVLEHEGALRFVGEVPVAFRNYSVGWVRGRDGKHHVSVAIHPQRFRELKSYFEMLATRASIRELEEEFRALRFQTYGPVRRQLWDLRQVVNDARKRQGKGPVPETVVPEGIHFGKRFVDDVELRPLRAA